jgi:hypothetical protein
MEIKKNDNKTCVSLEYFYGWGIGFYNQTTYLEYEKIVNEFISETGLKLSIESGNGICAQVGDLSNGIYFHAMDTVFSGDYNKPELIHKFAEIVRRHNKF